MARVSNELLKRVAQEVRPHITPYLEARGHITDIELETVIKTHTHWNIRSERSLRIIQELLPEV